MSQHDMNLANADGATFRGDLNAALTALVGLSSGATAPSTTFAYMWWADTTTGLLKIRNGANTGWVTVGTLASTNLGLTGGVYRVPTTITAAVHSLTNDDNGKAFIYNQSCAVSIALPNSLVNGWNVSVYNMAPASLTPVIFTASVWAGSGTQLHLQARPGFNRLDISMVNSMYFTTPRQYATPGVNPAYAVSSTHILSHGLAGTPAGPIWVHMECVSSQSGWEPGDTFLLPLGPDSTNTSGGYNGVAMTSLSNISYVRGNQSYIMLNKLTSSLTTASLNNWRSSIIVEFS